MYLDFSVLVLLVMKDISTIAPLSHDLNFKPMPAKASPMIFIEMPANDIYPAMYVKDDVMEKCQKIRTDYYINYNINIMNDL